jgi:phosphate transport system substrate-binding protein
MDRTELAKIHFFHERFQSWQENGLFDYLFRIVVKYYAHVGSVTGNAMNLKARLFLISLIFVILIPSCRSTKIQGDPQNAKSSISISGAFALYPLMQQWSEEYQKLHPNITFDISAGGAGKGMTDTLSGMVDIGMISREISSDEEAKGAFWIAVAKDAVFPVINTKNPVATDLLQKGITRETLIGIYITGTIKTWGQVVGRPDITDEIHVYTRSDSCGAGDTWGKYLGKAQDSLLGIGVSGDPGIIDAVIKDPSGISFNNLAYAFDTSTGALLPGSIVLPIDSNKNGTADADETYKTKSEAIAAINNGKYPSPPARLLYLATKGKPSGPVNEFLHWILTDGQKLVSESGYIEMTSDLLKTSLQKLN